MDTAHLILEDGSELRGQAFGAGADRVFEIVFNTSLTGYQEILSDPSYRGQGVVFTNPHIGNTGIIPQDVESAAAPGFGPGGARRQPGRFQLARQPTLGAWLAAHGVPGISGVDTRFLTRKLREGGTLQSRHLTTRGTPAEDLVEMARAWPGLDGVDTVRAVSCSTAYTWEPDPAQQAGWVQAEPSELSTSLPFDFGIKRSILRHLSLPGSPGHRRAGLEHRRRGAGSPTGRRAAFQRPGRPGRAALRRGNRARLDRKRAAGVWHLPRPPVDWPRPGRRRPAASSLAITPAITRCATAPAARC